MKIDGSCHCGFIKYEAEVNPDEVYICHCADCQSISGSPFRWAVSVPEEHFKLLSGEPNSPLKKAPLTGFHPTAKHKVAKAVSPSSETMRTI